MKIWFLVSFLMILALGCTFSPVDEYYKDIKKPDFNSTKYSISLDEHKDGDTIYLYNSPDFKYNIQIPQGTIRQVTVNLGNSQVYSSYKLSGVFNMSGYLHTGIFEMKIEYIVSSGTGSLADVAGSENLKVWKKWILKIDINPPPAPNVKASVVNGFLKFTWDQYKKPNFVSYNVTYLKGHAVVRSTITDPAKNYLIDSSYVGNETPYCTVSTKAIGEGESSTGKFTSAIGIGTIKYDQQDSVATVTWDRPSCFNACNKYELYADNVLQFTSTSISDTSSTFKLNALFGSPSYIELRFFPKYPYSGYSSYESNSKFITSTVATKKLARPWSELYYNKGTNSILAYNGSSWSSLFYRFDSNLSYLDSITFNTGNPIIPYSGTKIYYNRSTQGSFYYMDILTKMEDTKQVDVPVPYRLPDLGGPKLAAASGNGVFCYTYFTYAPIDYIGIGSKIFNENTNTYPYNSAVKTVYYKDRFKYNDTFTISDDGASVLLNGTFYNITTSNIVTVGTLSPAQFREYRKDDPTEILAFNSGLEIYKASDLSLKRKISAPSGYSYLSYDPVTKNSVFVNTSSVCLINIDTQEKKYIKMHPSVISTGRFLGGYFIAADGQYLKL